MYSVEDLQNLGKLSAQVWKRDFNCLVRLLFQIREIVEKFVKDPSWEEYIDVSKGWNYAVFELETL
jgi:preprotein translocase subunit Sss1